MLQFLPEIESDMSVFHRIEDVYTMEASLFFRRVLCLPAYDGALAAQYQRQRDEQQHLAPARPAPVPDAEEAAWAAAFGAMFPGEQITTVGADQLITEYVNGRG